MEGTVLRTTPFRVVYWLAWGYVGFFVGYVVADILKAQMLLRLAVSACAAAMFLLFYVLLPILPRLRLNRNKSPTAAQWICIGVSLLWIGDGVWTWIIKR